MWSACVPRGRGRRRGRRGRWRRRRQRGIRKSTPCRVCTRAGKWPRGLPRPDRSWPGRPFCLTERGAGAARNREPPGSESQAPSPQPRCLWALGDTHGGSSALGSSPLSLTAEPCFPPGVFLVQGVGAPLPPLSPPFLSLLLILSPSTLLPPNAPRPACPFLTRKEKTWILQPVPSPRPNTAALVKFCSLQFFCRTCFLNLLSLLLGWPRGLQMVVFLSLE